MQEVDLVAAKRSYLVAVLEKVEHRPEIEEGMSAPSHLLSSYSEVLSLSVDGAPQAYDETFDRQP